MGGVSKKNYGTILLLILAGEAVFILPFVLARIFRPTFLQVFDLSNTQLGYCFAVYGFVALASYCFGGFLADRFSARLLIGTALLLTALGGFYMASIPNYQSLLILYGYFGFTTIFLFWAALIKATRIWGGQDAQGTAFGFLDGGRGLVAALFGAIGVWVFALMLPDDTAQLTGLARKDAFTRVLLISSSLVLAVGVLILLTLRLPNAAANTAGSVFEWKHAKTALGYRSVWLLMIIILCGYFGYKCTDLFSLYASDVMAYNELEAAGVGTYLLAIRPIVGLGIGLLADRSRPSRFLVLGFGLTVVGSLLYASGFITAGYPMVFLLSLLITAVGVYSIRVLYFAVLPEGGIPLAITGTAVGIISFVGYTPDIFAGPTMGYFLDTYPGITGHQYVFGILAAFGLVGLLASIAYARHARAISA